MAGVASGADLAAQRRLGLEPNEAAAADLHAKLMSRTGFGPGHPRAGDCRPRSTPISAAAPCLLLAASLDDALAVEERPNMPGTVDEWPNWRLGLPVPLEELEQMALPRLHRGQPQPAAGRTVSRRLCPRKPAAAP